MRGEANEFEAASQRVNICRSRARPIQIRPINDDDRAGGNLDFLRICGSPRALRAEALARPSTESKTLSWMRCSNCSGTFLGSEEHCFFQDREYDQEIDEWSRSGESLSFCSGECRFSLVIKRARVMEAKKRMKSGFGIENEFVCQR